MPKRKTQKEFEDQVFELYHGQYSVIGDYINNHTSIKIRCNNCGCEFDRIPVGILQGRLTCYNCGEYSQNIRSRMISDRCLWKTHPYIAKLLQDKDDGYRYSFSTHTALNFICPDCGTIVTKRPLEILNKNNRFVCPFCSDGFSYPEKFFRSVLDQCGVDYIFQFNSKHADWCELYKYDFYLTQYNIICETNGIQHYETCFNTFMTTLEEQQYIDSQKIELAKNNGVNVITIDCRISDIDYIRESIINSDLSHILDLSNIDWECCGRYAISSLCTLVCKLWDGNYSRIDEMANQNHLHVNTILKYLTDGSRLGLCDFNLEEYKKYTKQIHYKKVGLALQRPIKCIETNEVFESRKAAMEHYGFDIKTRDINKPNRTSHGYHWVYLDQLNQEAS